MTKEEDQKICDLLRSRNKKGLDLLFQVYYTSLVLWANTFLNSLPAAEDLVQEFFITVWKDRFYEKFQAHHLSSFLRIVVKNRALNKLEKRDVLQSVTGLEHIELARRNIMTGTIGLSVLSRRKFYCYLPGAGK